jgi:ribosomal protein S18 acetylase RimI-like enzyme
MKIDSEFGSCEYSFEFDIFGEFVHIFNLYVFPKFRRNGHAKYLLRKAIESIKSTGYTGEILIVAKPEENSISLEKLTEFYEGMGLRVFSQYYQV